MKFRNLNKQFSQDDVSSLVNLLSLSTSLRVLDLTDCGVLLDKLWPALKYGCLQVYGSPPGGPTWNMCVR